MMPCFYPLTAWRGPMLPSGKRSVVFKPTESTGGLSALPQKLPCGSCLGCKLDYAQDWSIRCLREAQMHEENCFVTLTYDEEHFPVDGSLDVRDFQLFMKKLRRRHGDRKIRFFHAGEYGEKFGRPHYHALLFGFNFKDREPLRVTPSGSKLDFSRELSDLWAKGYCSVGDVTVESASYVARYCTKKLLGDGDPDAEGPNGLKRYERISDYGEVVQVKPEYTTMSRGGRSPEGENLRGIGYSWFKKYGRDIYPHDFTIVNGDRKLPPPRYFDNLYEVEKPLDMAAIKLHRVARCGGKEEVWNDELQKVQKLDRSRADRLKVAEECARARMKRFKREMESGQ